MKKKAKDTTLCCPAGHDLPHTAASGMQCTPLYCSVDAEPEVMAPRVKKAGKKASKLERAVAVAVAAAPPSVVGVATAEESLEAYADARKKHVLRQAHYEAWKDVLPIPKDLKGADAEKWADDKLVELLPAAVSDLERDLKFGSDSQRASARDKILDATGRGKTDKAFGGSAPIIMLNMTPGDIPWLKREKKTELTAETIDAQK